MFYLPQVYLKKATPTPALASSSSSSAGVMSGSNSGTIVKPEKQAAKAQRKLLPRKFRFAMWQALCKTTHYPGGEQLDSHIPLWAIEMGRQMTLLLLLLQRIHTKDSQVTHWETAAVSSKDNLDFSLALLSLMVCKIGCASAGKQQQEGGQERVQGDQFRAMKANKDGGKKSQGEKFRALKAKEAAKRAARLGAQVPSTLDSL